MSVVKKSSFFSQKFSDFSRICRICGTCSAIDLAEKAKFRRQLVAARCWTLFFRWRTTEWSAKLVTDRQRWAGSCSVVLAYRSLQKTAACSLTHHPHLFVTYGSLLYVPRSSDPFICITLCRPRWSMCKSALMANVWIVWSQRRWKQRERRSSSTSDNHVGCFAAFFNKNKQITHHTLLTLTSRRQLTELPMVTWCNAVLVYSPFIDR